MGENFKFQAIAEEASRLLMRDRDEMTAFGISESFIAFGTFNGCIHILFIESNEGMMIGPYLPIKDLCCLGDSIAYVSGKQVVLYNTRSQRESLSCVVQDAVKIGICSSLMGSTALSCITQTNLIVIQKGWVTTSIKTLKIELIDAYELVTHGHLACVADSNRAFVVNLTNEDCVYQTSAAWGLGRFHWMTNEVLLISSGSLIEVIRYSSAAGIDNMNILEKINTENPPISIASFNSCNIVILTQQLIILNSQREVIFKGSPPTTGKILANNKANSPFFLIGSNQIFKVELPNAKEKIKILVHELKFEKAYELSERFKLDINDVLHSHIEYLIKTKMFEDAAGLVKSKLSKSDKFLLKVIEEFAKQHKLQLIGRDIPYIENDELNILIFEELQEHREILKLYLQKWPLATITKPSMINKLKILGFNDILIDNFIKLGKTTESLKIALDTKSEKCFEVLAKFPETFSLFHEVPNFLKDLFELDCKLAGRLCENNQLEIIKVVKWLPSSLLIKFLADYDKLDLALEQILFHEMLKHSPNMLEDFIKKVKYLEFEFIFEAIKNTKLEYLKVFMLRKIGNEAEIKEILKNNFDVRLKFIRYYPELWPETLVQAKEDIGRIRKVLRYLHYYEDAIGFIKTVEFKDYEPEIKEFIVRQGKMLDIYKNSVQAAKIEAFQEFRKLYFEYARGIVVHHPLVCFKCLHPVSPARLRKCGHHSHKDCVDKCSICVDPAFLREL